VIAVDIFSLVILFFAVSMVFRLIKRISKPAKQNQQQTQTQTATAKPRPAPMPAAKKPDDYRFPAARKPAPTPAPVFQEGRTPGAVVASDLSEYMPITPSSGLTTQFSNYKGSLDTMAVEGVGYQPKAYEGGAVPYRTDPKNKVKVLPESFDRDALLQAVVMSEILKRPGARR
jgi:hypothetical protein